MNKQFLFFIWILFYNSLYSMQNEDNCGSLGIFTLVLGVNRDNISNLIESNNKLSFNFYSPVFPNLHIQRGNGEQLNFLVDADCRSSYKNLFDLSKNELIAEETTVEIKKKEILSYPFSSPHEGASGGLALLLSKRFIDKLPAFSNKNTYQINKFIFATGSLNGEDIDEVGGLLMKMVGMIEFVVVNSINNYLLLIPEKQKFEFDRIKHIFNIYKVDLEKKFCFVNSRKEVEQGNFLQLLNNDIKIINATQILKTNTIREIDLASFIFSFLVTLWHEIVSDENNSIESMNLFLRYYGEYSFYFESKPELMKIIHEKCWPELLMKFNKASYLKPILVFIEDILLNANIGHDLKVGLLKSLLCFVKNIIENNINDFDSLHKIVDFIFSIERKNFNKSNGISDELNNIKKEIAKQIGYCDKVIELIKKMQRIKDNNKSSVNNSLDKYLLCIDKKSVTWGERYSKYEGNVPKEIESMQLKFYKQYEDKDFINEIQTEAFEFNICDSNKLILSLLDDLKAQKNNELLKALEEYYGINNYFGENITAKIFFSEIKELCYEEKNILTMFHYLDLCIEEKRIFELDNSEFKREWKSFILGWINKHSNNERFASLLIRYAIMRSCRKEESKGEENKKDAKKLEFYGNLLADILINNELNERFVIFVINLIGKKYCNHLFEGFIKRAHQLKNNYLKVYFLDVFYNYLLLLVSEIFNEQKFFTNNTKDICILREEFAVLFCSLSESQQLLFIQKKFNKQESKKDESYNDFYLLLSFLSIIAKNYSNGNDLSDLHSFFLTTTNGWLIKENKQNNYQVVKSIIDLVQSYLKNDAIKNELIGCKDFSIELDFYFGKGYKSFNCFDDYKLIFSSCENFYKLLSALLCKIKDYKENLIFKTFKQELEKKKKHFEEQIGMAEKVKNKYTCMYLEALKEINLTLEEIEKK